jgi:hypothetical protein
MRRDRREGMQVWTLIEESDIEPGYNAAAE